MPVCYSHLKPQLLFYFLIWGPQAGFSKNTTPYEKCWKKLGKNHSCPYSDLQNRFYGNVNRIGRILALASSPHIFLNKFLGLRELNIDLFTIKVIALYISSKKVNSVEFFV